MGDVGGGFGRPGDGARTRRRKDQLPVGVWLLRLWTIPGAGVPAVRSCIQGGIQVSKMDILSVNIAYRKVGRLKTMHQLSLVIRKADSAGANRGISIIKDLSSSKRRGAYSAQGENGRHYRES